MVRREALTEGALPAVAETEVVAGEPGAAELATKRQHAGAQGADGLRGVESSGAVDGEGARVVEHHAPVRAERDVDVLAGDDAEVIDGPGGKLERDAVAGASNDAEVSPRVRGGARRGRVGHPRSRRVGHLAGERSTAEAAGEANMGIDRDQIMSYHTPMRNPLVRRPAERGRKMTTHQRAVHANEIRWARERAKHYDNVTRLKAQVLDAGAALYAVTPRLPPELREVIEVNVAALIDGFTGLWDYSGHQLPIPLRDYAAGVMDELRRQAAAREVTPG